METKETEKEKAENPEEWHMLGAGSLEASREEAQSTGPKVAETSTKIATDSAVTQPPTYVK